MNILVAGATGFVGQKLIPELIKSQHRVFALTRNKNHSRVSDQVTWLEGDLLAPERLPELGKLDRAYYLVHSLKSEVDRFEYEEAMSAVNFVNWLRPTGAKIIYLGGLGPDVKSLSPHLRSRHLTGAILGASGLGAVEFRASIVIGEGSLSFEMIKAISERFPMRPDFDLLNRPCQPIALEDLIQYLLRVLSHDIQGHQIYEIGGPDVTSYGELLDLYSELSRLKRKKVKIPEVDIKVLLKALDYSIPEHSQIGKKLTESLDQPTVMTSDLAKKTFPDIHPIGLRAAMDKARADSKSDYPPIWEKDFLKTLLSDKILSQSGLLSPDLLRNLEKVGKLRDIFLRK